MRVYINFPKLKEIEDFLKNQATLPLTYPMVGASKHGNVKSFDNDFNTIYLGLGDQVWQQAKNALQTWNHFPSKWTAIRPENIPLQTGQNVGVLFRLFGVWWLNSARIVYTLDEKNCFGFAYGTLPGHIELGEECFWVERADDGKIYYHIRAFSKPSFWLAKLGYPVARLYQRRFVRESMQQMYQLANQIKTNHE